jgi:hypothetical protein
MKKKPCTLMKRKPCTLMKRKPRTLMEKACTIIQLISLKLNKNEFFIIKTAVIGAPVAVASCKIRVLL